MRFAYADPPYPGKNARVHYGYDYEVNHDILIGTLVEEFSDGWALSTHSNALRDLLPKCPQDVRVAAWVKPFAAMKKNCVPCYAWEPVIFRTEKKRSFKKGSSETLQSVHDWISIMPPVFSGEARGRGVATKGCKPERFCYWICDILGFKPGDEIIDLFPGSGIMDESVVSYGSQYDLFKKTEHENSMDDYDAQTLWEVQQ